MPIHKLADGPITMTIVDCERTEGQFGAQWKFTGDGDRIVFVSDLSGARQLARLNLTPETTLGETLTFSQTKKDGKTFNNIDRAAAPSAAPAAATAPVRATSATSSAPVAAAKVTPADMREVYGECVRVAFETLGVLCVNEGVPIDASAIQAAAATLFIRVSR